MYVLYGLVAGVLWGFLMYFAFEWLAGYSLLLAYLGNILLIIVALAADELTFSMYTRAFQSEAALRELEKSRFFRLFLGAFVSFKAILYLFYILIMLLSQIVTYYPTLVHENVTNFIVANEYSILILVAIDLFSGQIRIDKKRRTRLSKEFENRLNELH